LEVCHSSLSDGIDELQHFDGPYRRKGYAIQALTAIEEKVKDPEASYIRLHLFSHDQAARVLYDKVGY
jgi:RimJ/RimL family protein N-acetyltransferase